MSRCQPRRRRRDGFVLIAVLVIVGSALLVATSVTYFAQSELAAQRNVGEAEQSRAVAWSGAQAVMSRLNAQRDRILDGEIPELDDDYIIYEVGTRTGVVRLLELTAGGDRLVPEAGRLDVNTATPEMLTATGLIDEPLAQEIVSYRDQTLGRPFQSVAELLNVDGMTPERLYGPLEELPIMNNVAAPGTSIDDAIGGGFHDTSVSGLADVITVYGFEPQLQRNGKLRINLNVEWSEELGRRLDERFGEGAGQAVKQVMDQGTSFESDARIIQVMRFFEMEPQEWPDIIDALTTEEGDFHFGRLDINSAPYEALIALPGMTPEQANQIINMRDGLGADERFSIAWPAIEAILEPEAYDELAGRITTRCWTYRLRLAAGEVIGDDIEAPLNNPAVYEVVIDLCDPRPRIAYLRDLTMLRTSILLAGSAEFRPEDGEGVDSSIDDSISGETEADSTTPGIFGSSLGFDSLSESFGDADGEDGAKGDDGDEDAAPGGPADRGSLPPGGSADTTQRRRIGRWQSG